MLTAVAGVDPRRHTRRRKDHGGTDMTINDRALAGRTALVTGAGSGIGAAVAAALVEAGARVVCAGRTHDKVRAVAGTLGEAALALALDVTDADACAALPGSLPGDWRGIDILVNNAGHDRGGRQPFHEGDIGDWTSIVETNVAGMMRVTRALLPGMLERGAAHVVNIGSTAGLAGYAGGAAYAASKHAVRGFSESLRLDLADTAVRVSEVLPGLVGTGFAYARWPDEQARAKAFYESRPKLAPADIARAVCYVLCEPPGVEIVSMLVRPKGEG